MLSVAPISLKAVSFPLFIGNKTIFLSLLRSPLWLVGGLLVGNGRYGRIREYDVSPECIANQWVLHQSCTCGDLQKVSFWEVLRTSRVSCEPPPNEPLHRKLVSTIDGEWCNIHCPLSAVCVMLCVRSFGPLFSCSVCGFLCVCVTFRFCPLFFNPILLRFLELLNWKTVLTAHLPWLTSSPHPHPSTPPHPLKQLNLHLFQTVALKDWLELIGSLSLKRTCRNLMAGVKTASKRAGCFQRTFKVKVLFGKKE